MQDAHVKRSIRAGVDISSNYVDIDYENKRSKKKKISFKLKPGKIFLIALLGYIAFSFGQVYWQIVQLDKEIAHYQAIKKELLEERQKLQAEFEKLHSEAYIEREARKKLGLVKPGETVILPAKPGKVIPLDKPQAGEIMD